MKKIKCYCTLSLPGGELVGLHPYTKERGIDLRKQLKEINKAYKKHMGYKIVIGEVILPKEKNVTRPNRL